MCSASESRGEIEQGILQNPPALAVGRLRKGAEVNMETLLDAHASEAVTNSRQRRKQGTIFCDRNGHSPNDGPCSVCGAPPLVMITAARDALRAAFSDRLEKLESARATAERHILGEDELRKSLHPLKIVDLALVQKIVVECYGLARISREEGWGQEMQSVVARIRALVEMGRG